MHWLTNLRDPRLPDAYLYVSRIGDETQVQAWRNLVVWLEGKIIGDPQPTASMTVEELKRQRMVGIYAREPADVA